MTVATVRSSTHSVFDAGLVTIAHVQEVPVAKIGERAVVLGASMGGLLAARVLADFYRTVVVIERDVLLDDPAQRRGVPQGNHVHALLSSGSQILGRLFPGLLDELVADGAKLLDEGDLSSVSLRFGGHELDRSGKFADPAPLVCYLASRPFLESHVRRRVSAIGNLTILDGHDVVELVAAEPDRVTGATHPGVPRNPRLWPSGAGSQGGAGGLRQPVAADPTGRARRESDLCGSGAGTSDRWSVVLLRG